MPKLIDIEVALTQKNDICDIQESKTDSVEENLIWYLMKRRPK